MLGKLLKYDIKSVLPLHLGMYGFLSLLGIVTLIVSKVYENNTGNLILAIALSMLSVSIIIFIVITLVTSLLIFVLRYRSNLLKDEGYLMHTLPVSSTELHFSKLITNIILFIIDITVAGVVYSIAGWSVEWLRQFKMLLVNEIGTKNALLFLIYVIVAMITVLSQIYFSLNLGYMRSSNKDLISIVAYIGTYGISQGAAALGMIIISLKNLKSLNIIFDSDMLPKSFIIDIFMCMTIIFIILSVIYNILSVKNRIKNLICSNYFIQNVC